MAEAPLPLPEDLLASREGTTPVSRDAPGLIDDARARYNARLLAVAQGLFSLASMNMFATASLAGLMLAPHSGWATLPITTYVLGTALATWPAALLMQRIGRRPGFMLGAALGVAAGLLATWAIFERQFLLFCLATMLQGVYQAFAQYYRFAATDVASPAFRPQAVGWVLTGSIAGALFGPILIDATKDLLAPVTFAGNFAAAGVITLLALFVLVWLDLPAPREEKAAAASATQGSHATAVPETAETTHRQPPARSVERAGGRSFRTLLRQPRLMAAVLTGMMAYGMMNLLMTASPLAMVGCGLSVQQSSWVIQWHVLAMYAPSFITGALIARHGAERIAAIGLVLSGLAAIIHMTGVRMENFGFGLVLLGLGWNFAYVAATTMVAECHAPEERARVQGFNDMMVFATVALTSLASGQLLEGLGWTAVNMALFPMLAVAAAALAWLVLRSRAAASVCEPDTGRG
jgi:MFS family permease